MFLTDVEPGVRRRNRRACGERATQLSAGNAPWSAFFPAGTPVIALPDWDRPRLLVPAATAGDRWRGSGFYPAFRLTARTYRWLLRLSAAAGTTAVRTSREVVEGPTLQEFLADVVPGATVRAVMFGMANRAQKLTAQLVTADGRVTGYLKCAFSELGRMRLSHEHALLRVLPPEAGPRPLKFGEFAGMEALITQAVSGRLLRAVLPQPLELLEYTRSLETPTCLPVQHHPWFRRREFAQHPELHGIAEALREREWAVVRQHGDLVPWNVVRDATGRLTAVDWEYGCAEGFPGLDLAHYILQVAKLIYRWTPDRARAYATGCLQDCGYGTSAAEASAIVTLAAFNAYSATLLDGHGMSDPLQVWRRSFWTAGPPNNGRVLT
jgi:hypothetical protein